MSSVYSEESVSGVATVSIPQWPQAVQFTVTPNSASGTGTVTFKPYGGTEFEPMYDNDGVELTLDLSASATRSVVAAAIEEIKVSSDNSADTFSLSAMPLG